MTQDHLSRHPLHVSVLESFADLRAAPSEQQASFTATISRILTEAFIKNDPHYQMPAFLIDAGVDIVRLEMQYDEEQVAPGANETIDTTIARWNDAFAQDPTTQTIVTSGRFALCATFETLGNLMDHPVIQAGGILGFVDPIYEDSLILIRISAASQADWHFRLLGNDVAA